MICRLLNKNDYDQFFDLINHFRETNFTLHDFEELLVSQKQVEIYVLEMDNKLIGAGTILYEKKFIHNISLYAHIEDIIIKNEYQGKGYGKILITYLINICKKRKCYKILLDCESDLIQFYEKCGFTDKEGPEKAIDDLLNLDNF